MAHCGGCHETFSTVANFDKHRSKNGECQQPHAVGLEANTRGTWKTPSEVDISEIFKHRGDK